MKGQPVRELQEMLLLLSYENAEIPQIIPDGKFGERTLEAVMVFQRDRGLPVTGAVDFETWQAVYAAWRDARLRLGPPSPLRMLDGHGNRNHIPPVPVVQAIFNALSAVLTNFRYATAEQDYVAENTREVQKAFHMEPTGRLDRAAWEGTARLYALFITRNAGARWSRAAEREHVS